MDPLPGTYALILEVRDRARDPGRASRKPAPRPRLVRLCGQRLRTGRFAGALCPSCAARPQTSLAYRLPQDGRPDPGNLVYPGTAAA